MPNTNDIVKGTYTGYIYYNTLESTTVEQANLDRKTKRIVGCKVSEVLLYYTERL